MAHVPVLLQEALAALNVRDGGLYVDATFGGGGYARAILEAAECRLIALDRDPDAIARGQALAVTYPQHFQLIHSSFVAVDKIVEEPVDGIVFDLGVSSFQLDEAARGFSFREDAPLDMRMSLAGPSAADAVNRLSEAALGEALARLGEDHEARRIARTLVRARAAAPIASTAQLAALVEEAVGGRKGAKIHSATRTFQALRLLVNDELGELARALAAAERALKPGGRLVVVSFHSLEDRLVKSFLTARGGARGGGSRHMPATQSEVRPSFALHARGGVTPAAAELAANPRARSARLRWGERTAAPAWPETEEAPLAPLAAREWAAIAR
ncbi:MAG: 16S rRNA (cytosine(1402)-N(4))-methyltransferase RsmH [Hyphomonadaceae bacterium]